MPGMLQTRAFTLTPLSPPNIIEACLSPTSPFQGGLSLATYKEVHPSPLASPPSLFASPTTTYQYMHTIVFNYSFLHWLFHHIRI